MRLRLMIRQMRNYWSMQLFIFVQLTAAFAVCILCGTAIQYYWKDYLPFGGYFDRGGIYLTTLGEITDPDTEMPISDSKRLAEKLVDGKAVSEYTADAFWFYDKMSAAFTGRAYDGEIVKRLEPEMEEGRWLGEHIAENGLVEAVIAPNSLGIGVGDVIEAWDPSAMSEDYSTKLRVVGILSPDAAVWGIGITEDSDLDYRAVYSKAEMHTFGTDPLLIINKDQLDEAKQATGRTGIGLIVNGAMLIMFEPEKQGDTLKERLDYFYDPWNQSGFDSVEDLTVMRDNSIRYLTGKTFQYGLVFLCFFVLVLVSTVSVSSIISLMQQREYGIFCLIGMEKKECWILQGTGFLIGIGASFLTAFGLMEALVKLRLLSANVVKAGVIPALLCIALAAVCGALGFVVPAFIGRKITVKEAVRGTERE